MSEVNNIGLNAFLAQQYAPKQSEKIPTPAASEKAKSEPSKNADNRSVVVKISAAARSMLEETRALEKRQADANRANAAIDKRLETVRLDSQRLEETLSSKITEAA
ncbi:MAG: hypothetical protein ACPGZR_12445 [Paracoccaceae bacterium]|jgi:hypothetical protein|tara:strand:+ start:131 stop:448 length:318 start_codon:yes stop_codon:yes gene_type:complete